MEKKLYCCFCNISARKNERLIDTPFAKNERFCAISSIGAMVEGWSLVIPYQHTYSLVDLYKDGEFLQFANAVISTVIEEYGRVIVFEHGSNTEGSITACGTNHAHLHIVPYSKSLFPELQKSGLLWQLIEIKDLDLFVGRNEYLFYSDIDNENGIIRGYVHILSEPFSQYFRRIIAMDMGFPDKYDYKLHTFLDNSNATAKALIAHHNKAV